MTLPTKEADESILNDEEAAPLKGPSISGIEPHSSNDTSSSWSFLSKKLFPILLICLLAVGAVLMVNRKSGGTTKCPGNLVWSDCPCSKLCNDGSSECLIIDCREGCGCPEDMPYLISPGTCSSTCNQDWIKVSERIAVDPTDCGWSKNSIQMPNELFSQVDTEIFHLRLSPTFPCVTGSLDVLLHFTLLSKKKSCSDVPKEHLVLYENKKVVNAVAVACLDTNSDEFDEKIRGAWFYYIARISDISENAEISYQIGVRRRSTASADIRTFVSPLKPASSPLPDDERPILVLGDTASEGVGKVSNSAVRTAGKTGYSLVIHVGDASYATNRGDCWGKPLGFEPKGTCGYDCSGLHCSGAAKVQAEAMRDSYKWATMLDSKLAGKTLWVSTMGNHDNDLPWFVTYRPPMVGAVPGVSQEYFSWTSNDSRFMDSTVSNAQKQAIAIDLMKQPHFYSFDHGLVHVISIGTEDNPINAYESSDGNPLSKELLHRFNIHFGKESKQYKWLIEDLKQAVKNRDRVPWILMYTHRPMFHTARHHKWCSKGGDWYGCLFVDTYEPLLNEYGVNFLISGHSHHYQRSFPMFKKNVVHSGTVHLIVGTGGYNLEGDAWVDTPEWLASRQGTALGFARFWVKNSTSIYWEHVSAETDVVLDSTWFNNPFIL